MGFTAIFGGTFNPPHIGHCEMLKALQNSDIIDEIFVMPDRIPPHKICDYLASDEDRINMCRKMICDFPKVELCLIEFEREGKSYSYDTVGLLMKKYPDKNFAFVCGGDMIMSFEKWYKFDKLMNMLPFIVFPRADIEDSELQNKLSALEQHGMKIIYMRHSIPQAASSEIRKSVDELSCLLTEKVYNYIKNKGIYSA